MPWRALIPLYQRRLALARRVGLVAGWLLLMIGLWSLVGSLIDWDPFDSPVGTPYPMGLVGSTGLVFLALSLLAQTRPGLRAAKVAAVLAASVAVVAGLGAADPGGVPPALSTTWSVAAVLGIAAATVVMAAFASRENAAPVLGIGGTVLIGIGISVVMVRLLGAFDLMASRGVTVVPLQLALAALLLGATSLALVWAEEPVSALFPAWVPAGVGLAAVAAAVFLWRAMVTREEAAIAHLTRQAVAAERMALRREVEASARVLRHFSMWSSSVGVTDSSLQFAALARDLPGVSTVVGLDSVGYPVTVLPSGAPTGPLLSALATPDALRGDGRNPVILLPVPGDTSSFVMHAARCAAGGCGYGVAALIRGEALLRGTVGERTSGYIFTAGARGLGRLRNGFEETLPLDLGDLDWAVSARPAPSTIGAARSTVPDLALVLGLAMSALLYGTVRLGISSRQRAHEMERMRLSNALGRATDSVWEWDLITGRVPRSESFWRHLGYEASSMGQTLEEWLDLVHPDDRSRVSSGLLTLAFGESELFEEEYRVAAANGTWHTVADRGRAVERGADGKSGRCFGIVADVTASRRAEQELRQAEALSGMGRVAAKVAHEINNPLAGIRSAFMLVKDAVPDTHPHHHYVGAIEREVERIATVTRQLYETYRPEPEDANGSLMTVASDAVVLLGEVNRGKKVTIHTEFDGVPSVVPFRGGLLRQIVYTLVQNAVDASPVGGRVLIHGAVVDRDLVLTITDEGPGVPAQLRERIFQPFFTTKDSSAATSGMGLGLTMVQRSVEGTGGRIVVDDAPDGGARFTVSLPFPQGDTTG
jgi:PAS domain S-box-containing protein